MTNYECITKLSVEDLAHWLKSITDDEFEDWNPIGCGSCIFRGTHHEEEECVDCEWKDGIVGWLYSEV